MELKIKQIAKFEFKLQAVPAGSSAIPNNISLIPNRSHTDLQDIGVNTHTQIDTHIDDVTIHFPDAPNDGNQYVRKDGDWEQVEISGVTINSINDINDVTIINPEDNEVLTYQNGVWINAPSTGESVTIGEVDGGSANSVFVQEQSIDGGSAN